MTVAKTAPSAAPTGWESEATALLASLDSLRVALTIFDAGGRLLHANAHLGYLFPALPRALSGQHHDEVMRLIAGCGALALPPGGVPAFLAAARAQLAPGQYAPRDIALADGRVLEIKARHTPQGHVVLLWSDVTAARAQLARLEERHRPVGRSLCLLRRQRPLPHRQCALCPDVRRRHRRPEGPRLCRHRWPW